MGVVRHPQRLSRPTLFRGLRHDWKRAVPEGRGNTGLLTDTETFPLGASAVAVGGEEGEGDGWESEGLGTWPCTTFYRKD